MAYLVIDLVGRVEQSINDGTLLLKRNNHFSSVTVRANCAFGNAQPEGEFCSVFWDGCHSFVLSVLFY